MIIRHRCIICEKPYNCDYCVDSTDDCGAAVCPDCENTINDFDDDFYPEED